MLQTRPVQPPERRERADEYLLDEPMARALRALADKGAMEHAKSVAGIPLAVLQRLRRIGAIEVMDMIGETRARITFKGRSMLPRALAALRSI